MISLIHISAVWLFHNWHMHNWQFWTFFWHLTSYLNHLSPLQDFFIDLVKHAKNTCEKIVNGQHHGAEPFLALPGTIPVEWGKNSLNHEWENGLWRAFLLAAGNQMGLWIVLLMCVYVCMHACVQVWGFMICGWMGGIMSITEHVINLDLIKIIDSVWRFMIYGCSPCLQMDVWVGGMGGWVMSCQIVKNGIDIDMIKIIHVCLKIYDLWRLLYLWVDVWVVGWISGVMSLTKNRLNF